MRATSIRTRWAAIGAAVAVALGAGGIGLVSATSPADATAYVPITPCRVADTRNDPAFNIGDRDTPIGAGETHTIAAHGSPGECPDIPATTTGVQLNVTAVGATAPTFLAIWGDGAQPNASSLNPVPGQPPTPNAVTTGLTDAGEFHVSNAFGSVDVIIDVVGLYTDHDHDDRYYTKSQTEARLGTKANTRAVYTRDEVDEMLAAQRVIAVGDAEPGFAVTGLGDAFETIAEVEIEVPADGALQIVGSAWFTQNLGTSVGCRIAIDGTGIASTTRWLSDTGSCSTNYTLGVGTGTSVISLQARSGGGQGFVQPRTVDVLFVPNG